MPAFITDHGITSSRVGSFRFSNSAVAVKKKLVALPRANLHQIEQGLFDAEEALLAVSRSCFLLQVQDFFEKAGLAVDYQGFSTIVMCMSLYRGPNIQELDWATGFVISRTGIPTVHDATEAELLTLYQNDFLKRNENVAFLNAHDYEGNLLGYRGLFLNLLYLTGQVRLAELLPASKSISSCLLRFYGRTYQRRGILNLGDQMPGLFDLPQLIKFCEDEIAMAWAEIQSENLILA